MVIVPIKSILVLVVALQVFKTEVAWGDNTDPIPVEHCQRLFPVIVYVSQQVYGMPKLSVLHDPKLITAFILAQVPFFADMHTFWIIGALPGAVTWTFIQLVHPPGVHWELSVQEVLTFEGGIEGQVDVEIPIVRVLRKKQRLVVQVTPKKSAVQGLTSTVAFPISCSSYL